MEMFNLRIHVDKGGFGYPRVKFEDEDGYQYHVNLVSDENPVPQSGLRRGYPTLYKNMPPNWPGPSDTRQLDLSAKANAKVYEAIKAFIGDGTVIREARAAERKAREDERTAALAQEATKTRELLKSLYREWNSDGDDTRTLAAAGACAELALASDEVVNRLRYVLANGSLE